MNQLVTESQKGLLPTANNQIVMVPSPGQTQVHTSQSQQAIQQQVLTQ